MTDKAQAAHDPAVEVAETLRLLESQRVTRRVDLAAAVAFSRHALTETGNNVDGAAAALPVMYLRSRYPTWASLAVLAADALIELAKLRGGQ